MAGGRPAGCQRFGMSGKGFLDVGYRVLKSGPVRSFCLFRKDQDQDQS